MANWRDAAAPEDQEHLDQLLSAVMPFAHQMLEEHGEFYPYAAVIDGAGEPMMVAVESDDEFPDSAAVLALLVEQLSARSAEVRATALVADVRADGGDAVRVELEHRAGHAMTVVVPYTGGGGDPVELGQPWAVAGPFQIWPAPGGVTEFG